MEGEYLSLDTAKKIAEKDKEIERLNKELDKTRLSELNKEYIINELEKWLYDKQVDRGDICDFLNFDKEIKVHEVRNKLQELKGE